MKTPKPKTIRLSTLQTFSKPSTISNSQSLYRGLRRSLRVCLHISIYHAEWLLRTRVEFTEIATFKRNQYRAKVAADKASGKTVEEDPEDEDALAEGDESRIDKDGQPAAKKARRDPNGGTGDAASGSLGEIAELGNMDREEGEEEEEEKHGDETEDDEDEQEERLEVEEPLEDQEEPEGEDEALDNGEDSD
jgi:DNA polymerase epsilon subunit 3